MTMTIYIHVKAILDWRYLISMFSEPVESKHCDTWRYECHEQLIKRGVKLDKNTDKV